MSRDLVARAALLLLLAACSHGTDAPPRVVPVGRIEGVVHLRDDVEAVPRVIANTTDPDVCGDRQVVPDLEVSQEGGVANVILFLEGMTPEPSGAPETLVLDNRGCQFAPRAAVLRAGGTIEATNSDAVLHTTHLYGPAELNFSLPTRGTTQKRVLDRPGLYVVKCDIHGWMQAFVRVDDHPFHAVTDEQGRFHIEDVPAGGPYSLHVWHEKLGELTRELSVAEGTTTEVELGYVLAEK